MGSWSDKNIPSAGFEFETVHLRFGVRGSGFGVRGSGFGVRGPKNCLTDNPLFLSTSENVVLF